MVLKTNVSFPAMEYDQDVSILPAFRKLVNFYWVFDKSVVFEVLQISEKTSQSVNHTEVSILQKRIRDISVDFQATNDIQVGDISVTRAWMHAILWRLTTNHGLTCSCNDPVTSISYPTKVAKEFLDVVSRLPIAAVEPHGPSMVKLTV